MRIACIHVAVLPARRLAARRSRAARAPRWSSPMRRGRAPASSPARPRRRKLGIAVGMTAAQAVAIASDLVVRAASPAAEHAAQAALCDVAYSCSPRVEEGGMGTVYCDADGLQGLYASEAELARAIVAPGARARPRGVGRHRRHQDRRAARGARRRRLRGDPAARGVAFPRAAADSSAGARARRCRRRWRAGACARSAIWRRCRRARWRRGSVPPARSWRAAPAARTSTRSRRARCRCTSRRRRSSSTASTTSSRSSSWCAACSIGLIARLALRGLICGDLRLSLGLAGRGRDERTRDRRGAEQRDQAAADADPPAPRSASADRRGGDRPPRRRPRAPARRCSSTSSAPTVRRPPSSPPPWRAWPRCAAPSGSARRWWRIRIGRTRTR